MPVGHFDGIVEVGENVAHVFDTDRQPHQLGSDPSVALLLDRKLGMGGGGGVDDQRFGVADVGQQREQLQRIDQLLACLVAALDAEGDQGALAVRHVFLRPRAYLLEDSPG